ncbi:L,D-transpeptidase [Ancylobacter lacus]|uniref:L,D-transpeptidase n=1 Tax=Ancylobacter lacus TaxID=2579970 RepID=UPI001BD0C185|nr:L,D-transpeptidase [Ancylobacter lacus]MBS7537810.1 L,D-transpeptidase [Ancylobacter lacus]
MRTSLLSRAGGGALAVAVLALTGALLSSAGAQTRPPADLRNTVMQIDEKPGYVPSDGESQLDPAFRKQPVYFRTTEPPGTIIIHTDERFLYLVQGDNRAIRYGIGVGRDGFQWSGLEHVTRKAEWPDWTPPPEMIARQPYLPRFMAGGPGNPMGSAALYLGKTVYRIHGTNMPDTIGLAVSSGCFRLVNADVTDLYNRVPVGTKVIIRQAPTL